MRYIGGSKNYNTNISNPFIGVPVFVFIYLFVFTFFMRIYLRITMHYKLIKYWTAPGPGSKLIFENSLLKILAQL